MQRLSKKSVAGILIRVPKAFVKLCYSHTRSTSQGTFISLPPADGIFQIIHCDFRTVITDYLKETEPEAVTQRRYPAQFKRRRFYAAGVNDIWAQDQHDKWGKKFGLWFHLDGNVADGAAASMAAVMQEYVVDENGVIDLTADKDLLDDK